MRQQVNLYQPILRREKKVFSASALVISLGVVIAGLVLTSALMLWGQRLQGEELRALERQKRNAQARVSELEARYQPPASSEALQGEVQRLRAELSAKEQFLERFEPASVSFGDGFGPWLEGLSRQIFDGIWLNRFSLYGAGHINLSGGALQPENVPRLIQRLGQEPAFQGRHFRQLRVERTGESREPISFTLTSDDAADSGARP